MSPTLTTETTDAYCAIQRCLKEFDRVYPMMSLVTMQVFLEIAQHGGITTSELKSRVRASEPAVLRHVRLLGPKGYRSTKGLSLVDVRRAYPSLTLKAFLNERGRELAIAVAKALRPDTELPRPEDFPSAEGRSQQP